jgi:hypothetical protein
MAERRRRDSPGETLRDRFRGAIVLKLLAVRRTDIRNTDLLG